jgi:hypothetical protein
MEVSVHADVIAVFAKIYQQIDVSDLESNFKEATFEQWKVLIGTESIIHIAAVDDKL